MQIFIAAEEWLISLADKIPVELFVMVGAAVEEILAPIPSPIIMTIAGGIAKAQNAGVIDLILLALMGGLAKTAASWLVYVVSDKMEDVVIGKFGKYLGVTSKEVEKIGSYLKGGFKDVLLIAFARALPIMPTAPVSIACGVMKVNLRAYLVGTGIGTIVRSFMYMGLGYLGLASADTIIKGLDNLESLVEILMAAVGILIFAWMYYRRRKENDIMGLIKRTFKL